MPQFLCTRTCFVPAVPDEKPSLHEQGQVYQFSKLDKDFGKHFLRIEESEKELDFYEASEEELMASDWKAKDLQTFMFDNFNKKIKLPAKKETLVKTLLYTRANYVGTTEQTNL